MKHSLISKAEIERSKFNEEIIRDTASQVIKDFATFGLYINFPEDIHYAYDDLFDQLVLHIEELMKVNPEKLSSLLYQIDIDEKKMHYSKPEAFHEHEWVTEMILEREFMKVLTRHYFKNHPDKL